jgi:pSer/pThr/pTyr-binding forkhead associated (FHA) protein/tetratricopeptide (TPR) repeat protein
VLKLIIEDDEGRKTVVPFVREEITIGRQEGNTIRLTERNVSRRHARLMRQNGHVVVEDLGSSNGTRINGERISGQSPVKDGDLIQIGDYDLALQSEAGAAPTIRQRTVTAELKPEDIDAAEAEDSSPGEPETETEAPVAEQEDEAAAAQNKDQRRHSTAIIKMDQVEGNRSRKVQDLEAEDAPRLVVVSSELKGQEYSCIRTEMKIGRTDDNDIVIDHRSLSRTHAKLVREDNGEWRIIDMQSANGLTVNGETYAQSSLNSGDTIELGHVKLRFVGAGEAPGSLGPSGRSKLPLVLALVALVLIGGGAAFFLLKPGPGTPGTVNPPPDEVAQPGGTQTPPPDTNPPPEQPTPNGTVDAAKKLAERIQEAQKNLDEGDLDKAEATLRPAQNADGTWPPEAQALAMGIEAERKASNAISAAQSAFDQKKYDEAENLLKDAKDSSLFAARRDQLLTAIEQARKGSAPTPDPGKPPTKPPTPPVADAKEQAAAAYSDARMLHKAKQFTEARTLLAKCIELVPDDAECHLLMGICYAKENDWSKAKPFYSRFLELAPDHKLAPDVRGSLKRLEEQEGK